jgi:flagellar biosynthetic protein FliO
VKVLLWSLIILVLSLSPAFGQLAQNPARNDAGNTDSDTALAADHVRATPAAEFEEAEMHFPVLRTVGGLGLVVCLMIAIYFAARKLAPRYFPKCASDRTLKVIETLAMGDKRSISLIEVSNKRFLVGNTPHQINLLAALPEPVPLAAEPHVLPSTPKDTVRKESRTPFRNIFEAERKRTSQIGNPLPEDIRAKMRQLRETLER